MEFLIDWLENVHRYKIQQTTLQGYRIKINGKIKAYFGSEITLDDCKPKLIHSFYESLRAEGSRRTLPLIPDVEEILIRHKKKQEGNRKQFRRGYSVKYLDMVCVDQMGNLLKPNYVTTRFPEVLKKYGLRPI